MPRKPSLPLMVLRHTAIIAVAGGVGAGAELGLGLGLPLSLGLGGAALLGGYLFTGSGALPSLPKAAAHRQLASRMATLEDRIAAIEQANAAIPDAELTARMEGICATIRTMAAQLTQEDIGFSRMLAQLGSYLDHAAQISQRYAELDAKGKAAPLRPRFLALLDSVQDALLAEEKRLSDGERLHLDIEMEVLETRMKQEGILE